MAELSKLRWQCRRGTKELDLLLIDYLENRYLDSSEQRQAQFVALLALEDAELMPVLMDFIK